MKILSYLLGISILISGIDVMLITTRLDACPRCRRALPKGPRKLPHPGFPKKNIHQNLSPNNIQNNMPKNDIQGNLNEQK